MKRFYIIILLSFACCHSIWAQGCQDTVLENFGPYLNYKGNSSNSNQMIIQYGIDSCDQRFYYIAYWNASVPTPYIVPMTTSKILNTRSCEYIKTQNIKYKILSATLTTGLVAGNTYKYFVFRSGESVTNKIYTTKTSISAADVLATNGKPLVLLNDATLTGATNFTGEIKLISGKSNVILNNSTDYALLQGNTFTVSLMDASWSSPTYRFVVPDNSATKVSCLFVSDSQDWTYLYYSYILQLLQTDNSPAFMLHGGDFGWHAKEKIDQIKQFPDLFGNLPVQATEGNHDLGYHTKYQPYPTNPVNSDNQINVTSDPAFYTKGMIWFDKFFNYNFPGLTTVTTAQGTIPDYYSHYYSFDNGPVHVCVLDYDNLYKDSKTKDDAFVIKQLKWLVDDLSNTTKQWKVILVHAYDNSNNYSIPFNYGGIFTDNIYRNTNVILDTIVRKKKVTVILDGHYHYYRHNAIVRNDSTNYYKIRLTESSTTSANLFFKLTFSNDTFICRRYNNTVNDITTKCKLNNDSNLILIR